MSNVLADKKVLIVGGTSGIGRAVAEHAMQRGADVIVASRNPAAHMDVLDERSGTPARSYALDISDSEEQGRLFEAVGAIDHLVVTVRPEVESAHFLSIDSGDAKSAFATKFWGQYELIQAAHSHMRKAGSITLTSGIAGERIYAGASTITLVNSATESLCRILAVELAPLRVNVVSPGFVEPKPESMREYANRFPAERLASPDEVALAYLGVMENPYMTGAVTVVDGGARLV